MKSSTDFGGSSYTRKQNDEQVTSPSAFAILGYETVSHAQGDACAEHET